MVKKKKSLSSKQLAELIIEGIREKKGKEIVTINFKGLENTITDYFVICHGTSSSQVEAISENISEFVRKNSGLKPWHSEGQRNAEWVLLDYIDVVVHVFLETSREFYKIEKLWADAEVKYLKDEE